MNGIKQETFVSIGLLAAMITATWVLAGAINGAKGEINTAKVEIINRTVRLEERVTATEKNRESWTDADMFRWAVHLQRENPTLKIPEPEMHTTR